MRAAVVAALLRAVRAGWARGGPVRALTIAVPTTLTLAFCWCIVLPVLGAVMTAVWAIAALVTALGVAVRVVSWALGAPAVHQAAQQLAMLKLVWWFASTVLVAWTTWRVARRVA